MDEHQVRKLKFQKYILIAIVGVLTIALLCVLILNGKDNNPPPHTHNFIDGVCVCGETQNNNTDNADNSTQHTHSFINGKCSCGELDPNWTVPETPPANINKDKIEFNGFEYINNEVLGDHYYIRLSNSTTEIKLYETIENSEDVIWILCKDLECTQQIPSKTVFLNEGDNIYYVLKQDFKNNVEIYKINLYRNKMIKVYFEGADPVSVEETKLVVPPELGEKKGYQFISWDFDFSQHIFEHQYIEGVWEANTYVLSFQSQEGTGVMESLQVKTDEIVTLPEPTFVYPGYNLTKWKYPQPWSNYDNVCAADGTFKMPPYNVVLSAVWEPNLNTIRFVDNYLDDYQAINCVTDSIITISNYRGYVPGYTFVGWSPEQDNSTTIYKEYSNYKVGPEPEQILYAVYEPVNYYIEYICRLNSLTGKDITNLIVNNPNPTSFNIESEDIVLQPIEIDGYIFLGWADTDGNICNDMSVKKGSMRNQIFYAIFKKAINYLDLKTIQNQFNIKNHSNNNLAFYSKTYNSDLYESDFTGLPSTNFAYAYIDYDAKTQIGTLKYLFALVTDNATDLANKIETLSNHYSGMLKVFNINIYNGFYVAWCHLELSDLLEIENIKQMYASDNEIMSTFALIPYQISQLDKNNVLNIIELYNEYFAMNKVVIKS